MVHRWYSDGEKCKFECHITDSRAETFYISQTKNLRAECRVKRYIAVRQKVETICYTSLLYKMLALWPPQDTSVAKPTCVEMSQPVRNTGSTDEGVQQISKARFAMKLRLKPLPKTPLPILLLTL